MDANVISDAVNLSARVEGLNKFYQTDFLISETTFNKLKNKNQYPIRLIDKVAVKGKKRPIYLYEIYFHEKKRCLFTPMKKHSKPTKKERFRKLFQDLKKPFKKSLVTIHARSSSNAVKHSAKALFLKIGMGLMS